tara:strand:+ start:1026 stop:1745 length:720 start_codon:yes stop_codon:yes gene_type:complete
VSYKVNLNDFEGPLDLLLFFIKRDKLNIYDIPISKITTDFLNYISKLNNMNIEVGAEFIYMASLLMKIKSKMLLPKEELEKEEDISDPRLDLVLQLIEYKKYKQISKTLSKISDKYTKRHKTEIKNNYTDIPIKTDDILIGNFNLYDIIKTYNQLIKNIPDNTYDIDNEKFSITEQIKLISSQIKSKKKIKFSTIIKQVKSRSYLVCSFIAILEMIRRNEIKIEQKNSFSEIYIINNIN